MTHHTPLPIVFTFLVVSHLPATAQEAAPEPPPLSSPELAADGSVAFAMPAPNATNVMVRGQWPEGQAAMAKGEDGVWRVTVGPVPAGVWEYRFEVDGLSMIDPLNHWIKPMHSPRTSILHVPGNPPLPHDFQDVPHGVVHQHTYRSASLGRLRDMAVYTPPGYDAGAAARYPVLYLQHGNGDNEGTWVVHGKAHWILDNLIAAGRAKPMLIVMLDGHAVPRQGRGANTERFEADLLNDAIPYVEQRYRVIPESTGRALVGLSMGGAPGAHHRSEAFRSIRLDRRVQCLRTRRGGRGFRPRGSGDHKRTAGVALADMRKGRSSHAAERGVCRAACGEGDRSRVASDRGRSQLAGVATPPGRPRPRALSMTPRP